MLKKVRSLKRCEAVSTQWYGCETEVLHFLQLKRIVGIG